MQPLRVVKVQECNQSNTRDKKGKYAKQKGWHGRRPFRISKGVAAISISRRPVHPTVVDGDEIDVLADAVRAEALDTATRAEMASPESKTEELNNGTNIMIYLL
jgi:hypothetical protein